jgi:hypothetical protein
VVSVTIFGFTQPNFIPQLDPRFGPGVYRLEYALGFEPPRPENPIPPFRFRHSMTFIVRE